MQISEVELGSDNVIMVPGDYRQSPPRAKALWQKLLEQLLPKARVDLGCVS